MTPTFGFFRQLLTADKGIFLRSCWRSLKTLQKDDLSLRASLVAAYRWICTAQDATPDNGVAAWYDLMRGWSPSYPETTGYIIPTLLTYASIMEEHEARVRAIRMADWEVSIQLPTGAVRSGTLEMKVAPAVFNTGQVLFGWVEAYRLTKEKKYSEAIEKAAQWLIHVQDADGAWRKDLSILTSNKVQTYNVRSAWGLALAGILLNEPRWLKAACRNCEWVLKQQRDNGWFTYNGFAEAETALLHTIGYTLEGLLGVGMLMNMEEYIQPVQIGVQPLVSEYEKVGKLGGMYDPDWRCCVSWRCLTGDAQIALVLLRLAKYQNGNNSSLKKMAIGILKDLAKIQDIEASRQEISGGLAGSHPVWGGYCEFLYINWSVKFYMDALLLALFDIDVQDMTYVGTPTLIKELKNHGRADLFSSRDVLKGEQPG